MNRSSQKGGRVVHYPGIPLYPADLTVDLIYDLPAKDDEPYRKPPPLRENRGYMFGARVHFLNGCCLDFAEATSRYAGKEKEFLVGDPAKEPFIYRRRANVHAPDVLLPWNDRVVTSTTDLPKVAPGETIFDLVVRSGQMQTGTASRFLIPPRVTFDLAEQSGLFDRAARPRAAFVGRIRAQMDKSLGVFPVARSGMLAFPHPTPEPDPCAPNVKPKVMHVAEKQEESRGSVLVLDAQASPPRVDFYADPMARVVAVCFVENDVHRPDLFPDTSRTEFWPVGSDSGEAMPVVLLLKKGRRGDREHRLGWFDERDTVVEIQPKNAAKPARFRQLAVVLVPGAKVDLEIFSMPYCKEPGDRHHAVSNALSLLRMFHQKQGITKIGNFGLADHHASEFHRIVQSLVSEDMEIQDKTCEELLSRRALAQVTTKRVVTVVHAVDRPAKPRFLTADGTATGRLRFFPISIKAGAVNQFVNVVPGGPKPTLDKAAKTPGPELDKATNIQKSWHDYVEAQETWDGFVKNGRLQKATLDEHCHPLAAGTPISPEMLKDKDRNPKPRLERACWDSEEGGITTFFVGEVLIDRLTTGRLRCEARWLEYSPAIIRQNGVGGPWIANAAPPRYARLFEIGDIEPHVEVGTQSKGSNRTEDHLDQFDLLRKNTANFRFLAYPFVDGRARHLTLQLIATSRFTNYFPKGTESESWTETFDHSKAMVWLPCTFRPAQPEIDHILPVFHWQNEVHDDGRQIRWKRESSLRIFMGRDWFSSGEGEALALVCWPRNLFGSTKDEEDRAAPEISRRAMAALDPPFDAGGTASVSKEEGNANKEADAHAAGSAHRYGQFITRWGADPIHLSGSLDDVISADRFEHSRQKVTKNGFNNDLLLSLPDSDLPGEESSKPLAVCLVTYQPSLDTGEGTWFADVTIDHGASYFPFVQLGLVRYQAHAVSGLELSYPVAAFAQIPPRRQGQVTFANDYEFEFELSGIGFHRSETDVDPKRRKHDKERYKSDVPALDIKLMSGAEPGYLPASGDRINWQPVLDRSRKAVEWLDQRPIQRGADVVWTQKIKLPSSRRHHRYALLIEEYEYMAADVVSRDPITNRPSFTTNVIRRGPVFSHIIDLGASCP